MGNSWRLLLVLLSALFINGCVGTPDKEDGTMGKKVNF